MMNGRRGGWRLARAAQRSEGAEPAGQQDDRSRRERELPPALAPACLPDERLRLGTGG
jgi:hypothetical protein